jgi:hypothetical protein
VIHSEAPSKPTPAPHKEKSMRRRRWQKGSLQLRRRGKCQKWVVLYYDDGGHRRHHTPGNGSMTKSEARGKRDDFMRILNGGEQPEDGGMRPVLLREFLDQKVPAFQRGKWKKYTAGTSENRIQHHIVKGIGATALKDFSPTSLQAFIERKTDDGLSFSMVDHLRWDLSANFDGTARLVTSRRFFRKYGNCKGSSQPISTLTTTCTKSRWSSRPTARLHGSTAYPPGRAIQS